MSTFTNGHAVLVGISSYRDPRVGDLPEAVLNDAEKLAAMLSDPDRCGYASQSVRCLTGRSSAGKPAIVPSKTAILNSIDYLSDPAIVGEASTVILFFSCHGYVYNGKTYLLPADVNFNSPSEVIDSSISQEELVARIEAIPSSRLLLLFDCCHAEGLGVFKGSGSPAQQRGVTESLFDALEAGRGKVLMAACEAHEHSWILDGRQHSLFTQHLLEGLSGRAASGDGLVRVFGLFDYIQPRVTSEKRSQHPVFKSNLKTNFPVALNNAGEKGLAARFIAPSTAASNTFAYDVCIAHARADLEWVFAQLIPRLDAAGIRWTLTDDAIEKYRILSIQDAVQSSRFVLLVISPSYSEDEWTRTAGLLGIAHGLEKGQYRVIPVRIGEPPREVDLAIRALVGSDLTGSGARLSREFDKLIRALKSV